MTILLFVLLVAACASQKGVISLSSTEKSEVGSDTLEYELETFDPRFESWYELQKSPAKYRSQAYYEAWNDQYVSAWNYHASSGTGKGFFEPIIGYDFTEDYGFELNHELFYYFQYVENVLKIKILPSPDNPFSIHFASC